MIKFGTSSITDIFVGDKVVDKIYLGSDLKYQRTPPEPLLVFTGIDANGNYELDASYDGTAVAYMLGDPYLYYNYNLISPTPTEKARYATTVSGNLVYVYDETNQTYIHPTYTSSSDTLTPSWIEVGVTPAYTQSNGTRDNYQQVEKGTNNIGFGNNMFNYKYFEGLSADDLRKTYINETPPTLIPSIGDLVIPDTYKGVPVTEIAGCAMDGYRSANTQQKRIWYTSGNLPTSITLGANIQTLHNNAFKQINSYTNSTFTLNHKLTTLFAVSLGVYENTNTPINITFDSINAMTFYNTPLGSVNSDSSSNKYNGNITFNNNIQCSNGNSAYSIADQPTYAIFNSTVTSITGYLTTQSGSKLVFMHSASDPITLSLSKAKSAITTDIYTDNPTVQNYDWASMNITPTFHPLSDYTGS